MKKEKFNPYNQPHKPTPPSKMKHTYKVIWSDTSGSDIRINLADIPRDINGYLSVEKDYTDQYDCTISVEVIQEEITDNQNYDNEYAKYCKALERYDISIKEWLKMKKEYDKQKKEEQELSDRKLFEMLKKKFDK